MNISHKHTFADFDKLDRFFVGSQERLLKQWDSLAQTAAKLANTTNYPPYNIKKLEENKYLIEIAVAGFTKQDIELEFVDNTLVVRGKMETIDQLTADALYPTFLHRGIADRAFTRQFTLADNVEIKGADLFNGMLKIWLEAIIPEHKKPKKIEIRSPEGEKQLLTENIEKK